MAITPHTNLKLLKLPIELDNKNQVNFENATAQYNYFNSLNKLEVDNFTYQRKESIIRYPDHIDNIINYNYCMYQNENYTDKWYYAFITKMEYINDNMTAITIKCDTFQTWQFDITFKSTYVEREHVSDDTVGLHTIDEGLMCGEYTTSKETQVILNDPTSFYLCMGVTELPDESVPEYNNHRTYTGVFGGLYYLGFANAENCENCIKIYDKKGKADAIQNIFIMPTTGSYVSGTEHTWTIGNISCTLKYLLGTNSADYTATLSGTMPTKLGKSYIPKNGKLFTYPYSYMSLTNNAGSTQIFKYEDFKYNTETEYREIAWFIETVISPGMSMKATPINYKNLDYAYNYGIMLGKLPVCSWNSDVYTNWLTQNGLNVFGMKLDANQAGIFRSVSQVGGGALSTMLGDPMSGGSLIGTGLTGVFNTMQESYKADMTPNQANGNTNGGDINFGNNVDGGLSLYYMSIRDEIASVIDKYFNMYGYKVNELKVPNISTRTYWNYLKTIDCNIEGFIPKDDIDEIKMLFNNGITIWHTTTGFLNYDLDNSIS